MYENNTSTKMTLIVLPKHEQRENQPKRIFVIPIISHLQNLPYPKVKKIDCQRRPYMQVCFCNS